MVSILNFDTHKGDIRFQKISLKLIDFNLDTVKRLQFYNKDYQLNIVGGPDSGNEN